MATKKQINLINDLLDEMGWGREDVAREISGDCEEFEDLDIEDAAELITELLDRKRQEF